jgi:dynein heavy chain
LFLPAAKKVTFEINFTLSDPHHHTQFSLRAIHRIHQYTLGGPFNKKFRDELLLESYIPYLQVAVAGNSVPMRQLDATTTVVTLIATEADVAGWNSQGLPRDPVSSENGAIVTASTRWPLMIDPQLQGVAWVKARESGRLQVQRLGQTELIPGLRSAMAGGTTILIENIGEQIDAVLLPLLQRAILTKRDHQYIALGDDEVEYSPGFRLVLHTKLSNPHYPPELQAELTLVNFTVTPLGLEDQLLSLVIRKERPDLAARKAAVIHQANEFKVRIKQLEDDILVKLSTAEGDITEDRALIEGLESAKQQSLDASARLSEGKEISTSINKTAERYRMVAKRGATIFFLMNSLHCIHT